MVHVIETHGETVCSVPLPVGEAGKERNTPLTVIMDVLVVVFHDLFGDCSSDMDHVTVGNVHGHKCIWETRKPSNGVAYPVLSLFRRERGINGFGRRSRALYGEYGTGDGIIEDGHGGHVFDGRVQ